MGNVIELKQWYIISHDGEDYKVLLKKSQRYELGLYFPIHKPNVSLFNMVEFKEVKASQLFNLISEVI